MRCLVFMSLFAVAGVIFANQIDEDISDLKHLIKRSQNRLESMQHEKKLHAKKIQKSVKDDLDFKPALPISSQFKATYLAKDYTRYPENTYPIPFKYISADGDMQAEFHMWFQGDADSLMNINGLYVNDGRIQVPIARSNSIQRYWIRRARPNLQGDVYDYINYYFDVDFGLSNYAVYDAFVDVNYYRLLGFQFGFQMSLLSGIENYFENFGYLSRAFTQEMSHTQMLAPDRQFGFMFHGSLGPSGEEPYFRGLSLLGFDDFFSYQFGFFSGIADHEYPMNNFDVNVNLLRQDTNLLKYDFEWRIFMNPFIKEGHHVLKHLGVGVAGSNGSALNQEHLPTLVSIAQNMLYNYEFNPNYSSYQVIANGNRNRIHPQATWSYGALGIIADWTETNQTLASSMVSTNLIRHVIKQQNSASMISFIYNLSQEEFNLFHFFPNNNFKPLDLHSLGGFQLVFRLSQLNLDPVVFNDTFNVTQNGKDYTFYYFVDPRTSIQKANSWSIGLNWYWTQNLRFTFEYDQSSYIGGCSTGGMSATDGTPGCQIGAMDTYLSSSQVMNRPDEKVFMQRIQITF